MYATAAVATTQKQQPASPFAAAKLYAGKFAESGDPLMAFACVKHAANLVCLNPTLSMVGDVIEVVVNASVASSLTRLRQRIALYIPGATFAETSVDHTVGVNVFSGSQFTPKHGDHYTVTTARRKLIVSLPKPALSDVALSNMLDVLFTWTQPGEVEAEFAKWFSQEMPEVIACVKEHDKRTHTALQGLVETAAESIGWPNDGVEQLLFTVMTRRDGGFYRTVAESLEYAFN